MRVVLLVEGQTEKALRPVLKALLDAHAQGKRVGLQVRPYGGSEVWNAERVYRDARGMLQDPEVLGVILLVDVAPRFASPDDVRTHYGALPRFAAHCALHDFEAWLLPYWERVFREARRPAPKRCPWPNPEAVDLTKPPSRVLSEDVFTGKPAYRKTVHAPRILEGQDLGVAAAACPQLKAFLNTLLEFAGYDARM
jgi:hypothetical protein